MSATASLSEFLTLQDAIKSASYMTDDPFVKLRAANGSLKLLYITIFYFSTFILSSGIISNYYL
jgi:hypothetical protein